ncbi:hypothetical protein [Saccharopolyspora sp. 5N708]|uniref:hypothetical protein n=1 Tax=Saccharopolyspora sp. 5N708 TaxID=3457424 RepID=UPI003FD5D871
MPRRALPDAPPEDRYRRPPGERYQHEDLDRINPLRRPNLGGRGSRHVLAGQWEVRS